MKKDMGEKVMHRYGFVDAFNPKTKWFAEDVIGIDQGISVLMAENVRTGFVWDYFMRNPEVMHAMSEVQFHPDPEANRQVL
jgi:hypothetical protein